MADDTNTQDTEAGYALTAADAVEICTAKGARLVEFTEKENATEEKPVGTVTIELPNLKKVTFAAGSIKGATQDSVRSALASRISKESR